MGTTPFLGSRLLVTGALSAALVFGFFSCDVLRKDGDDISGNSSSPSTIKREKIAEVFKKLDIKHPASATKQPFFLDLPVGNREVKKIDGVAYTVFDAGPPPARALRCKRSNRPSSVVWSTTERSTAARVSRTAAMITNGSSVRSMPTSLALPE